MKQYQVITVVISKVIQMVQANSPMEASNIAQAHITNNDPNPDEIKIEIEVFQR